MPKYILLIFVLTVFFISCKENHSSYNKPKKTIEADSNTQKIEKAKFTDAVKLRKLSSWKRRGTVTLSEVLSTCGKPHETVIDNFGNCKLIYLTKDSEDKVYRTNFILNGSSVFETIGFDRPSWDE